jgi:hypothetical protein
MNAMNKNWTKEISLNLIPRDPLAVPVEEIRVAEWHPDLEPGRTEPTQVHILISAPRVQITVRLKSAQVCDELIAALKEHRRGVWGKWEPDPVTFVADDNGDWTEFKCTGCGEVFVFEDDGPIESGWKFCANCGGSIRDVIVAPEADREGDEEEDA